MESAIRYLVTLKMAGMSKHLEILKRYFMRNEPPWKIAELLGMRRLVVKGIAQYFRELLRARTLPSDDQVRKLLDIVMPYIDCIPSYCIHHDNGLVRCTICGEVVKYAEFRDHLRKHHQDLIEKITKSVMTKVISRLGVKLA